MRKSLIAGAIALLSLIPFAAAQAGTIAFTNPVSNAPTNYQANNPVNLGNVFTIGAPIFVDALGIYNMRELTGSESVGIYNSAGTLLTSTTVSLSDPLSGGYLFHSISPLALGPGTYTVVSQVFNNPWAYGTVGTAAGITFNYNDYRYDPTLQYPTTTGGSGPAYLGPNFQFTAVAAVPEPVTLSLFGAGLVGAVALRRRKKATKA